MSSGEDELTAMEQWMLENRDVSVGGRTGDDVAAEQAADSASSSGGSSGGGSSGGGSGGSGQAADNVTQGQAAGLMADPVSSSPPPEPSPPPSPDPSPPSGGRGGGGSGGGSSGGGSGGSGQAADNVTRGQAAGLMADPVSSRPPSDSTGSASQTTARPSRGRPSGGGGSSGGGGGQQAAGPSAPGTSATVAQGTTPAPDAPEPAPDPDPVGDQAIDVSAIDPAPPSDTEPSEPEKTADLGGVGIEGTDTRTADQDRAEQIQVIETAPPPGDPGPAVTEENIRGAPDAPEPTPPEDTAPADPEPSEPTPPEAPRFEDQAAESGGATLPTEPFVEATEAQMDAEAAAADAAAAGADISRPAPGDRTGVPTDTEGPTAAEARRDFRQQAQQAAAEPAVPGDTRGTAEPDIPGTAPPGRAGAAARTEGVGPTPAAQAGLFVEDIFFEGPGTPDVTDVDERLRGAGMAAAAIATEGVVEDDPFSLTGPEIGLNAAAFAGAAEGDFQQPADLFTVTSGGQGEVDQDIIDSLFGSGGFLPEGERELEQPPGQLTNPFTSQEQIEGLSDAEVREQFAAANPGIEAEDVTLGEERVPVTIGGATTGTGIPGQVPVTTFGLDVDEQDIRERVAAFNPGVDPEDVEFTADGQPVVTTGSGDVAQAAAGLIPGVPGAELSERALIQEAARQQERFSQSANVEAALRDFRPTSPFIDVGQPGEVGFREEVVQFGAGAAGLPGELAALPATGVFGVEQGAEFAENIGGTVEEFGGPETAATVTEGGARIGAGFVEQAREEPFRFGGEVGAELLFGAAAFGATTRGLDAVRAARLGGPAVDLDDISPPATLDPEGDVQLFETPPGAPTRQAVEEVRERAADQPEVLQEAFDVGEGSFLLRSESEPLPSTVEVEAGRFELPGLFASPDLSRLRITEGGFTQGIPRPRIGLPRVRGRGEQATLFPGERVRGMPESATGSGFAFDPDTGQRIPDPETAGARFLTEQAEPGTAFVRPPGSRSRELEAIFPPGTLFEEIGTFRVSRGPGQAIPGAAFRRVDVDADDVDDFADLEDAFDGELIPGSRIPETRVSRRADSEVTVPPGGVPTATGPSSPGVSDPTGLFTGPTSTPVSSPTTTGAPATTAPTTTGGVSDPSGLFTGPTSSNPFSEPTTTGGPTTTGPTSAGPTSGGPTTGGPTSGGPTTAPPAGPTTPPGPPPTSPGTPPTSPGSPPSSPGVPPPPPTTPLIPGVPGTPSAPPFGRPLFPEVEPDAPAPDEEPLFGPLGATFENPIVTAQESLANPFAGFGGLFGGAADAAGGGLFGEGAMDAGPANARNANGGGGQVIPNPFE